MGEFSSQVLSLVSRAAQEQGGVISGLNPSVYNPNDPFVLWVIQLIVILAMIQLLVTFLGRIRQPRVIAEVIAGIVLGPTAMGRIPGFTNAIFPAASLPMLTLTSTIGLVLYLFLVGLEIDVRLLKRNVLSSASVSVAGLAIPLGLGAALGVGIYKEFVSHTVNFGYFLLFVAVAVGITAFPVLCRILTELKLLDTEVGLVTLSAGIGNDVVGWILLALTVALVNASSGLTALWVLLASAGYTIFLLYPGRWAMRWLAKRTGSLEQGSPTVLMMSIILFTVFISAFYTDIIGVHPIFGGFLAGVIIPHDNGFAISIVEKLEDLVSIIFLPLYFVNSGLKTNLGLLNTGTIWGYIILICLVAFSSKFFACAGAARLNGYGWRESGAIGALMSCKGLVELIVLNIGLSANILTTQTFSMFVVHALILTFMTTPLVLLFYPAKYRVHHKEGQNDGDRLSTIVPTDGRKTKFAIVLDKVESLPPAMAISQLLQSPGATSRSSILSSSADEKAIEAGADVDLPPPSTGVTVEALRLVELTHRTSAVLRSTEADSIIYNDPVVSVYSTFGRLNSLNVSANLSVVSFDEFPATIANYAQETRAQMVIVPWARGHISIFDEEGSQDHGLVATTRNPFDGVYHRTVTQDQTSSIIYSEYIRRVFATSPVDTALFVDRGEANTPPSITKQHLFLAFFGGPDDRLALSFLVQLCERPSVTATVIRVSKTEGGVSSPISPVHSPLPHNTITAADTLYGQTDAQTRLASDTADNVLWDKYTNSTALRGLNQASALSRITFLSKSTPTPLRHVTEMVKAEGATARANYKSLIVFAGRSRRMAVESLGAELRTLASDGSSISSSAQKTLGDVGAALVATGVQASLLILQASPSRV